MGGFKNAVARGEPLKRGVVTRGNTVYVFRYTPLDNLFYITLHVFRYTPLDYALMGEHHEVAQYMLEQGALSITGNYGYSVFLDTQTPCVWSLIS